MLTSKEWLRNVAYAITIVIAAAPVFAGDTPSNRAELEYRVKAAFIYNFANFVSWPDEAFTGVDDPIGVCVLGVDPFGASLDQTLAGRAAHGRRLRVRRTSSSGALEGCHIVFVADVPGEPLARVMQNVVRSRALTIGESKNFLELGGMIRLDLQAGKVRFDVRVRGLHDSSPRISSQMLRLARDVQF